MADWRDRRVPEFQAYLRGVLGREPTERDYAAAVMQLEQRGAGSVAVGHAFRNRLATEGGDPARHLRHYDPIALGHRWKEVTPQAVDKWGAEYDRIGQGEGPLKPGQTHFFSPAGMQQYYNKDPSLVRSAVRMNVPGQGEVLVPNWATKAVSAGDYTNVNGEWFLTPNERYGRDVAVAERSQDAEAQPGYGPAPPRAPDRAVASAPGTAVATSTTTPSMPETTAPSRAPSAETAMRLAKAVVPESREPEDILSPISPRTPRGGAQMASAAVPYLDKVKNPMVLTRADGGPVEPPAGGAGRFASPVALTPPKDDDFTRRMLDRIAGVGRLPYAAGGAIDDTGVNVPETRDSLLAQQRELIEGRRPAQMFPRGTDELPLPPGMERIETPRGVFHFDPMVISAVDIDRASSMGRENEVLGLGPLSKTDVMDIVRRTGEQPVGITERDRAGNEVRASIATPSTVAEQSDEILRTANPDHIVDVEPIEGVVGARGRAMGGGISDVIQGIAGSGLLGLQPMAFADGIDEEDLISPMGGLMKQKARGGGIAGGPVVGSLVGTTGGRADKIPATARSGSHVLPADIVSHMGQGNTNAGLKALEKMFKTGPYGMPLPKRRADGGEVDGGEIPVMLSDGEFVIPPEVVAEIGNGDVQTGHDVLDGWIMQERQNALQTIAALPPPATD